MALDFKNYWYFNSLARRVFKAVVISAYKYNKHPSELVITNNNISAMSSTSENIRLKMLLSICRSML